MVVEKERRFDCPTCLSLPCRAGVNLLRILAMSLHQGAEFLGDWARWDISL